MATVQCGMPGFSPPHPAPSCASPMPPLRSPLSGAPRSAATSAPLPLAGFVAGLAMWAGSEAAASRQRWGRGQGWYLERTTTTRRPVRPTRGSVRSMLATVSKPARRPLRLPPPSSASNDSCPGFRRALRHVFAGPFASDDQPIGMPIPYLFSQLCDAEDPNPSLSYFVYSDLI